MMMMMMMMMMMVMEGCTAHGMVLFDLLRFISLFALTQRWEVLYSFFLRSQMTGLMWWQAMSCHVRPSP